MSVGEVLVLVFGLIALTCCVALFVGWLGRCSHEMYPQLHAGSNRVFMACRCGRRFEP